MEIRRRPPNPTVRVENLEYAVPHREAQAKNILEEIVWHKDIEIKNFKKIVSLEDLIKKIENLPAPKDFYKNILESKIKPGVIAEILNDDDLIYLKKIAENLKMSVLVEVHNSNELERTVSYTHLTLPTRDDV